MKVTKLAFWLFIAIAGGALFLLMAIPEARMRPAVGDPAQVAHDLVVAALGSGNAVTALDRLMAAPEECQWNAELAATRAALQQELAPIRLRELEAVPPTPAEIGALPARALVERLQARCHDRRIAAGTERLFARVQATPSGVPDLDARAVRLLARAPDGDWPAAALAMAEAFRTAGRERAWQRWLLRALAAAPADAAPRLRLGRSLVAQGRLGEALAVVTLPAADVPAGEAGLEWWRLRADLGRWLGDLAVEADALEQSMTLVADAASLQRLVETCFALEQPDRALRHAAARARLTARDADRLATAQLALQWGDLDLGIALLQEIGPGPLRRDAQQRLALLLEQDLRLEDALLVRRQLRTDGTADDVAAHEDLLRRLQRHGELADALLSRSAAAPIDLDLARELLHLLVTLDREADARVLLGRLLAERRPTREFFALLPMAARCGLDDLPAQAAARAQADDLRADDLPAVFAALLATQPYLATPALHDVLLRRFGDQPGVLAQFLALADAREDATARAAAIGALAHAHPEHPALWAAWLQRLDWAADEAGLVAARGAWLRLRPDDADNRFRLVTLLLAADRTAEAAAILGLQPGDVTASAVATALAALPVSTGVRREAADLLAGRSRYAAAAPLYDAILAAQPDDSHALLQAGRALAWSGRPGEAADRLQRFLRGTRGDAEVHLLLADVLEQSGQPALVEEQLRLALQACDTIAERSPQQQRLRATLLFRLGSLSEAEAAWRELLRQDPTDLPAHVALARVLLRSGQRGPAATALAHAAELGADDPDVLQMRSELLQAEGRFGAAAEPLQQRLGTGDDEELLATIATLQERGGDLREALASYQRWAIARPGRTPEAHAQRLADRIGSLAGGQVSYRQVGDDRAVEGGLIGALPLHDRLRAHFRLGAAEYRGRAAAFAGGTADAVADTPLLDLGAAWRHGRGHDQLGAGVMLAPDAPGDHDAGLWAGGHCSGGETFRSLEVRVHHDQLWTDPIAAAALGGRSHGIDLRAHQDLGAGCWAGAAAGYRRLRLQPPDGSHPDDDEWFAELSLGRILRQSDVAVADRFRPQMAPPGPDSPYLGRPAADAGGPQIAAWAGVRPTRLRDDAELAQLLPVSRRTDLLFLAGSVDQQLARHLGSRLEGWFGHDLHEHTESFGIDAALCFRPRAHLQCSLGGGFGRAFGRGGADADAAHIHCEILLRW